MKTIFVTSSRKLGIGLAFLVTLSGNALAADPLVDAAWAKANAGKAGIVFIDFQPATDFMRGHIPGAVNSNFAKDGWREERVSDKVPDMLAEPNKLAELIGKLGIDNDTHVVMVPPGLNSTDMGIGTRIYWTFKVLGHDKVSLLDGGMAAYTRDKANPLETGAANPRWSPDGRRLLFSSSLNYAQVRAALEKAGAVATPPWSPEKPARAANDTHNHAAAKKRDGTPKNASMICGLRRGMCLSAHREAERMKIICSSGVERSWRRRRPGTRCIVTFAFCSS